MKSDKELELEKQLEEVKQKGISEAREAYYNKHQALKKATMGSDRNNMYAAAQRMRNIGVIK